jgi:hypothetical protein
MHDLYFSAAVSVVPLHGNSAVFPGFKNTFPVKVKLFQIKIKMSFKDLETPTRFAFYS